MSVTLTPTNAWLDRLLQMRLNKGGSLGNLTLKLYVNNHTPVVTDTAAAYTECTATGYAAVTLTGASWTGSTTGGVADYTYPAVTFTFTAGLGQTIFGAYLVDQAGNVEAGLLDTAFAIPAGGGTVTINLEEKQQAC